MATSYHDDYKVCEHPGCERNAMDGHDYCRYHWLMKRQELGTDIDEDQLREASYE